MKLKKVNQVYEINFPRRAVTQTSKWANRQTLHETKRVLLANKSLILAENNGLQIHRFSQCQDIDDSGVKQQDFGFSNALSTIQLHTSPITCVGFSDSPEYICSCSEFSVVLSKWDSMLSMFSACKYSPVIMH